MSGKARVYSYLRFLDSLADAFADLVLHLIGAFLVSVFDVYIFTFLLSSTYGFQFEVSRAWSFSFSFCFFPWF
jgi:hypothetical protein